MASGSAIREFRPPPDEYEFDNLVADLSGEIRQEELEELKTRFKNIKDVRTPQEMFSVLREFQFISRCNILYIQQIVRILERADLVSKLERYVSMFEEDKILHMVQKSTEIADGYSIVQFHILGHGPLDTNELGTLRREVSRLLLCPLHEIIVKGIQETQSTLLTFMIPTMYAGYLIEQLVKQNQRIIKSLMELQVDTVIFAESEFGLQMEGNIYKTNKSYRGQKRSVKHIGKKYKTSVRFRKYQSPKIQILRKRSQPKKAQTSTKRSRIEHRIRTRSQTRNCSR